MRKPGRAAVGVCQKPCRHMLEVGKIDLGAAALFRGVGPVKAQRQLKQRPHGRRRRTHIAQQFLTCVRQKLRVLFDLRLTHIAHCLYVFGKLRVWRFRQPAEVRKFYRQKAFGPVPALVEGAGKIPELQRGLGDARPVFFGDFLLRRSLAHKKLHSVCPVLGGHFDVFQYLGAPGSLSRVVRFKFICRHLPRSPVLWSCVALHFSVYAHDELSQALIVAPPAHGVGKEAEALVGRLIALVHDALEHRGLYSLGPVLLDDPKLRREPRRVAVFAQEALAEAVDGAYLRPLAQRALAAQAAVIWLRRKTQGDLVHDAAAKLRRRGLGEGYDKKAVDIRVVGYPRQQPLGEHLGLAAAGRRRNEHRPAAGEYSVALGSRRSEFSHFPRLLQECSTPLLRQGAASDAYARRFRRR